MNGRFVRGHHLPGPGSPLAKHAVALKQAVMAAVSPDEMRRVIRKLHKLAIKGDTVVARILLDRLLGRIPIAEDPVAAEDFNPDERCL